MGKFLSHDNPMKLLYLFNLVPFLFFLALLLGLIKQWRKYREVNPTKNLPPGPPKLPIIGNLHQLLGKLPHHAITDLARNKYGPLMQIQLGEVPTVFISSPRLAKEIMKTHDLIFADRWQILIWWFTSYGGVDFAFAPYDNYWRKIRKICVQDFLSNKNVALFGSIRHQEYSKFVDFIRSVGENVPINISEKIFSCTNGIVTRAVFGKACKDQKKLAGILKETFAIGGGFGFADIFPSRKFLHFVMGTKRKLVRMRNKMDEILDTMINEYIENMEESTKEGNEKGNLIDVLLKARENGSDQIPITNNSIKAIIFVSLLSISIYNFIIFLAYFFSFVFFRVFLFSMVLYFS